MVVRIAFGTAADVVPQAAFYLGSFAQSFLTFLVPKRKDKEISIDQLIYMD